MAWLVVERGEVIYLCDNLVADDAILFFYIGIMGIVDT